MEVFTNKQFLETDLSINTCLIIIFVNFATACQVYVS